VAGRQFESIADLNRSEGKATMRIPSFILEHPVETLIAGLLLLVMLFGSADRHAAEVARTLPGHTAQLAAAASL
jgi:hypothetical protein